MLTSQAFHWFGRLCIGSSSRRAAPSSFDADYSLGYIASLLIVGEHTGCVATSSNLSKSIKAWVPGGIPVTQMMNNERRHDHDKLPDDQSGRIRR